MWERLPRRDLPRHFATSQPRNFTTSFLPGWDGCLEVLLHFQSGSASLSRLPGGDPTRESSPIAAFVRRTCLRADTHRQRRTPTLGSNYRQCHQCPASFPFLFCVISRGHGIRRRSPRAILFLAVRYLRSYNRWREAPVFIGIPECPGKYSARNTQKTEHK